jgi:predicted phage terminase large subunit-like protein
MKTLPLDVVKKTFDLSRANLVSFRNIVLSHGDDVNPAPFHYLWSDILLNGKGNVAVEAFRESAKSQYILRSFPLYALRFPAEDRSYIVIIKNNTTLARNKLRELQTEYITNPALKFNMIRIREQSADVFSVDVMDDDGKEINVRIEAYGKGSSIRGLAAQDRRPHICIIDDPQDIEDARSEVVTESDWTWYLSDVTFLGVSTRIFLIGNNLGERSIIERVFANAEHLRFTTHRIPVLNADGVPNWPEKQSSAQIHEERESFRKLGKLDVWMREKMCVAVSEEEQTFKKEDFRYYGFKTVDRLTQGMNIYMLVDPASSTQNTACYRALPIVAVDRDNQWYVLDCPYGRWDSSELIDVMFDKVRQWKPKAVGVEKGMLKQILDPFIKKEMKRRNMYFNIVDIEHAKQGSKLERVKMMGPRFKAHSVWFPDEGHWLAEMESELLGVTKDGFKSLFVDLIDALSMTEQIAETPFNASGQDLRNIQRTASVETTI